MFCFQTFFSYISYTFLHEKFVQPLLCSGWTFLGWQQLSCSSIFWLLSGCFAIIIILSGSFFVPNFEGFLSSKTKTKIPGKVPCGVTVTPTWLETQWTALYKAIEISNKKVTFMFSVLLSTFFHFVLFLETTELTSSRSAPSQRGKCWPGDETLASLLAKETTGSAWGSPVKGRECIFRKCVMRELHIPLGKTSGIQRSGKNTCGCVGAADAPALV